MTEVGCFNDMFIGRIVERGLPKGSKVKKFLKTSPDSSGYYECYAMIECGGFVVYAPVFVSRGCEDPVGYMTEKIALWIETFIEHVDSGEWQSGKSIFVGVSLKVKYHHVKDEIIARWSSYLFRQEIRDCADRFIASKGEKAGFLEVYEYCMENFMKFVGKEKEWGLI